NAFATCRRRLATMGLSGLFSAESSWAIVLVAIILGDWCNLHADNWNLSLRSFPCKRSPQLVCIEEESHVVTAILRRGRVHDKHAVLRCACAGATRDARGASTIPTRDCGHPGSVPPTAKLRRPRAADANQRSADRG